MNANLQLPIGILSPEDPDAILAELELQRAGDELLERLEREREEKEREQRAPVFFI